MSEPVRLRDSTASPLARALLHSAVLDVPPPHSRHKALAAAGLGMSLLTSATSAAAGAAATAATAAPGLAILKSLGVGLVAGAVVAGSATQITKSRPATDAVPRGAQSVAYVEPRTPPREAASPRAQSVLPAEPAADAPSTLAPKPPRAVTASLAATDERQLVQDARQALVGARRDFVRWGEEPHAEKRISQPALALALLRQYEEQNPGRKLGPDATVVRIEALALIGDRAAATALAERFVAEHPTHPSVVRVRALVGATR